jgi:acetyl-CoA acetyltransferase
MCATISDGAAAAVVCSKKGLLKMNAKRAIKIRVITLTSGPKRAPEEFERHIGRVAATATYNEASINPSDIDIVEVHDAAAYSEIQLFSHDLMPNEAVELLVFKLFSID